MSDEIEKILPSESPPPEDQPQATLHGNAFDLTSLGALASGVLLLFMCLTCNMGFYCLPILPFVLGIVGLVNARRAVNRQQSQTMAWIGLGSGGLALLLIAAGLVLYFGLMLVIILSEGSF